MNITPKIKKWVALGVVLFLALIVFIGLYNYSYIEITTPGNSEVQYTLHNQKTGKQTGFSSSGSMKKLVRRSSYELGAKTLQQSSFTVFSTGGFFGTTSITPNLEAENSRVFVGNNPGPCMFYTGNILVSSGCGVAYGKVVLHSPATATTPTATTPNSNNPIYGNLEGYARTEEGSFALIQYQSPDGEATPKHLVYQIGDNLKPIGNAIALDALDGTKSYSIKPFRSGFVVFSEKFDDVYYFATSKSQPARISVEPAKNKKVVSSSFDISLDTILVGYSEKTGTDDTSTRGSSEAVVFASGSSRHYSFKTNYKIFRACGINFLCALRSDKQLDVYDISGTKASLKYNIRGVDSVESTNHGALVIRNKEVINLTPEKASGYSGYDLSGYTVCGSELTKNGYVLCVFNGAGSRSALLIDQTQKNVDSIDKKVDGLRKIPDISNVSVYRNYIYVSPRISGESVYDPAISGFTYPAAKKKAAADAINRKINELGINRNAYKITITSN